MEWADCLTDSTRDTAFGTLGTRCFYNSDAPRHSTLRDLNHSARQFVKAIKVRMLTDKVLIKLLCHFCPRKQKAIIGLIIKIVICEKNA